MTLPPKPLGIGQWNAVRLSSYGQNTKDKHGLILSSQSIESLRHLSAATFCVRAAARFLMLSTHRQLVLYALACL